jgi:hypothetical protein
MNATNKPGEIAYATGQRFSRPERSMVRSSGWLRERSEEKGERRAEEEEGWPFDGAPVLFEKGRLRMRRRIRTRFVAVGESRRGKQTVWFLCAMPPAAFVAHRSSDDGLPVRAQFIRVIGAIPM